MPVRTPHFPDLLFGPAARLRKWEGALMGLLEDHGYRELHPSLVLRESLPDGTLRFFDGDELVALRWDFTVALAGLLARSFPTPPARVAPPMNWSGSRHSLRRHLAPRSAASQRHCRERRQGSAYRSRRGRRRPHPLPAAPHANHRIFLAGELVRRPTRRQSRCLLPGVHPLRASLRTAAIPNKRHLRTRHMPRAVLSAAEPVQSANHQRHPYLPTPRPCRTF